MSSTLYAQEIEDNQINENKEALLRKNLLKNETHENSIKRELNTETAKPILGENLLVLRPKTIPKNAFSYTKDCSVTNKLKPPLFPKPRDRQGETTEKETINIAMHSGVKIDSKAIKIDTSCSIFNFQTSVNSQKTDDPSDSFKSKLHCLDDYIEDTETIPPPLPSRPPPVFKYPLGTFYKEVQDLNKANDTIERQKQSKSLKIKSCLSDGITKIININDEISEIVTSSEIQENKSLPMLDLELLVKKDNFRSFPRETNSVNVQKRLISASDETEECQKPFPISIAESEANKHNRKSIPPDVFQNRLRSTPVGSQVNKLPQPLQGPESHIRKQNKKSLLSENTLSFFPKKPNRISLEINKPQKPLPVLDLELKRNIDFNPKSKTIDLQAMEQTKIKPSVKSNSLFHQRLEQILVEQRIRECPVSKLKQSLEVRLPELSETDWIDMSQSINQENISPARKMSLESSNESKIDESFISESESSLNLKFENIRKDTSLAELREEPGKVDLNQDRIADVSVFHSLNRPTLPQKMKSTQRSLSYTSLVQTVKDISTTIWNPPDKNKRSSTGMTSKMTEVVIGKNEHSASDRKSLEIHRFSEEEKEAIARSTWFHDISATEAQHRLLKLGQDGAFLVRPTSRPTDMIQYTASITYAGRVFNIHIRRKSNYYFALGKEKEGEKSFQKLSDLIKYYQDVPFDIHPAGSFDPHAICFRVTPPQ